MIGVVIRKSGVPQQSEAPSSEFRADRSSDQSGVPQQSQAPSLEFRGDRSSDLRIRAAPSIQGSILAVRR